MGASAVNGSFAERGGNHGCDTVAGTFFSDHFFDSGDNIVGGLTPPASKGARMNNVLRNCT
jgi:hypothetical protein